MKDVDLQLYKNKIHDMVRFSESYMRNGIRAWELEDEILKKIIFWSPVEIH